MAIVAPTTSNEELRERIFTAVQDMYAEVASCPAKGFHFPTGRPACEFVGYPHSELSTIPESAIESFAGVAYPFQAHVIRPGDTILDIGAGAGTDVLLAAMKTGPSGKVYGLDLTDAMIEKANANIKKARVNNIEIVKGNAETIPLPNTCCDVVTSNGVLNLVPDKSIAFGEINRVLRAGGHIQIADIVLERDLSEKSRNNPKLWAECIVGAIPEQQYVAMIQAAGFSDIRILDRLDYFERSSNDSTRDIARQYGAIAIVVTASKC